MKRYITILLCLSAFVLLTACSKQKSTANVELPEERCGICLVGRTH
ncbi:hypothetical protein [uncultured Enterococcus sp.]|nr:hypothetical protein [uncultured Enterococcus sp.]